MGNVILNTFYHVLLPNDLHVTLYVKPGHQDV